jgi:hypothetical protein
MIRGALIKWKGEFSMRPGRWSAFTATQSYTISPPGFVWNAIVRLAPFIPIRVRDAYENGEGSLSATILRFIRVAHERGTVQMAEGELQRYLAECVWLPSALLPASGVSWHAIDDDSATATMSDGMTTISMVAHFGSSGEIVRLSAIRPRAMNGAFVPTLWTVHVGDYARRDGMMVPTTGRVEWNPPSGPVPYFRATPTDIHYDFAP